MEQFSDAWLSEEIVRESRDAAIFSDREGVIHLWNRGAEEIAWLARR